MSARRNTIEDARGRWRDILGGLGFDHAFLRNKQGPCPMCGGKDRYRWDDKDGSGSYYCNQCGPGSGVTLLMKFHGWKFKEACDKIDAFLGNNFTIDARPAPKPAPPPIRNDRDKRRHAIERVLFEASAPDIVEEYLTARGLITFPEILQGHRSLGLYEERELLGRYPAVVAPILGPNGDLQGAHRIYLSDPRVKKVMPPVDTIAGGAARLFDAEGDTLGIAEGIETAISAYELFRIPVWSVISTSGIESFVPPPGLRRLVIFADNDRNFAGQKAAYTAAAKMQGIEVEVQVPPKPDTDWLDVLNEQRPPAPDRQHEGDIA